MLSNPGQADCAAGAAPAFTNCFFVSNVDNGWSSGRRPLDELVPATLTAAEDGLLELGFDLPMPSVSCLELVP
ncbi:MAG: hypothetical protein ACRDPY_18835 [Streptosporangiaceae bacterium]